MPPPNHHTGSLPSAVASKKRTFMCTVGAYGLRGCSTSDTPMASHARPASSGRAAIADGGRLAPRTCEKFTPPRSNTLPSSIRREIPPPPSARSQLSRKKGLPSTSSSACTIRACRSSSQALTAAGFGVDMWELDRNEKMNGDCTLMQPFRHFRFCYRHSRLPASFSLPTVIPAKAGIHAELANRRLIFYCDTSAAYQAPGPTMPSQTFRS